MTEKHQVEQRGSTSDYHYESQKIEDEKAPSYISNPDNMDDEESLQHGTKRGLDARHIQMISLGGAIGYILLQMHTHSLLLCTLY